MSKSTKSHQNAIELCRLVDEQCDAFESAWKRGERPAIETCLNLVPEQVCEESLGKLLAVELELTARSGQWPQIETYRERFPFHRRIVDLSFKDLEDWADSSQTVTPANRATLLTDVQDTESMAVDTYPSSTGNASTPPMSQSGQPDALPFPHIDRYEVIKTLGQGGMGTVLLVHDPVLDRQVALKIPDLDLHGELNVVERFYREARSMATVSHPNLCPVYDAGEFEGKHFLTMAYVEGQTLAEVIDHGRRPVGVSLQIVKTLAEALQVAHDGGIVHRDLKPSNVMMTEDGEPIVMDFGLATRHRDCDAGLTTTGTMIGSAAYMAPEQIEGGFKRAGVTADIYALGVILYELLSGRRPYEGSRLAVLGQITSGKMPASLASYVKVNPDLAAVCHQAMAHDPAERFQSAAEFAAALEPFVNGKECPSNGAPADSRTSRSRRSRQTIAFVLLLIAGGIAAAFSVFHITTPYGEILVSSPKGIDAEVHISQNGRIVDIAGPDDGWQVKVKAGTYRLDLHSPDYRLRLNRDTVVVERNDRETVRIVVRRRAETSGKTEGDQVTLPDRVPAPGAGASSPTTDFALRFDGSTSFVHVPGLSLNASGSATLECWVYPSEQNAARIMALQAGESRLQLSRTDNGFRAIGENTPSLQPGENSLLSPGEWVHLAAVFDEREVRLYVQGQLQDRNPRQAEEQHEQIVDEGLWIGAQPLDGRMLFHFNGQIDEIRVSSRACYDDNFLPEGHLHSDEHTLALYHCNEGSGTRLPDSSGNENHGTIVKAVWEKLCSRGTRPIAAAFPEGPPAAHAPFDAAQALNHQTEWAEYLDLPVEFENSIGMRFRLIPPGRFRMGGSPEVIAPVLHTARFDSFWQQRLLSQAAQHDVILTRPFYLAIHPVTQRQYEQVTGGNPSRFSRNGSDPERSRVAGQDTSKHPVDSVSWLDAVEFCRRLSEKENLSADAENKVPENEVAYRLPTEAEWEFACRAGTTTRFWFGTDEDLMVESGWFKNNSALKTHPVGCLRANAFGLYDVLGNVWEWVDDAWVPSFYHRFLKTEAIDPVAAFPAEELADGVLRVTRGGDWGDTIIGLRASARHPMAARARGAVHGFRVALTTDAVRISVD